MEKELPRNWVKVSFTDIFDINGGTQPPKAVFVDEPQDGYIRLLQIRDFGSKPVPTYIPDTGKLMTCKKDDILIARYGASIGRIVTGMEGSYNVALAKVSIPQNMNKNFVKWLLKSNLFQEPILSIQRTAQNGFNKTDLATISIPLPPLAEQNRMVEKLDRLFSQLESIKTSMEKIQVLLKNFRQQVLTQAVISTDTIKLRKVLVDIKYGTSKKSDYEIIGTPILRIPNIDNGYINDSDLKFSVLDKKELETLKLKENDILIIRSNGSVTLVGQSAIVTKEFESYSYAGYLIRIRLNEQYDSKYLNYIFKSNFIRSQMIDTSRSTSGINNINSKEIQDLNVPNIKVEEQQEIVSRVESLFAKADAIEEKYKSLKAKIETLPQTILYKAFKGELTEQLESDGDAKDLLEEIMALKSGDKPKKSVSKKYIQPDDEILRIVAEPVAMDYDKTVEKTAAWYDERFELWISQQGLAARGTVDKATLRELFDAMNDEDK